MHTGLNYHDMPVVNADDHHKALAEHYAAFWNDLEAAGLEPTDTGLWKAADELAGGDWVVFHDSRDGFWKVSHADEAPKVIRFAMNGQPLRYAFKQGSLWDEQKHPRGQPKNKGQFVSYAKQVAATREAAKKEPAAKKKVPAEKPVGRDTPTERPAQAPAPAAAPKQDTEADKNKRFEAIKKAVDVNYTAPTILDYIAKFSGYDFFRDYLLPSNSSTKNPLFKALGMDKTAQNAPWYAIGKRPFGFGGVIDNLKSRLKGTYVLGGFHLAQVPFNLAMMTAAAGVFGGGAFMPGLFTVGAASALVNSYAFLVNLGVNLRIKKAISDKERHAAAEAVRKHEGIINAVGKMKPPDDPKELIAAADKYLPDLEARRKSSGKPQEAHVGEHMNALEDKVASIAAKTAGASATAASYVTKNTLRLIGGLGLYALGAASATAGMTAAASNPWIFILSDKIVDPFFDGALACFKAGTEHLKNVGRFAREPSPEASGDALPMDMVKQLAQEFYDKLLEDVQKPKDTAPAKYAASRLHVYRCPYCGGIAYQNDPVQGGLFIGYAICSRCGHGFSILGKTPMAMPHSYAAQVRILRYAAARVPKGYVVNKDGRVFRAGMWVNQQDLATATPVTGKEGQPGAGVPHGPVEEARRQAAYFHEKRRARGPVNREQLFNEKLAPHAHQVLSPAETTHARRTFAGLHQHHGELTAHRIEELINGAHTALQHVHPNDELTRERLSKRLRGYHEMLAMHDAKMQGQGNARAAAGMPRGTKGTVLNHLAGTGAKGMTLDELRSAMGAGGQHALEAIKQLNEAGKIERVGDRVRMKGAGAAPAAAQAPNRTHFGQEKPSAFPGDEKPYAEMIRERMAAAQPKEQARKEPWEMSREELLQAAKGGKVGPYDNLGIEDPEEESKAATKMKVSAVLAGKKPIFEVYDKGEADDLIKKYGNQGLKAKQSTNGEAIFLYKDEAAYDRLNKLWNEGYTAKGSAEMGRALGYSDADIAAFYAANNFDLHDKAIAEHQKQASKPEVPHGRDQEKTQAQDIKDAHKDTRGLTSPAPAAASDTSYAKQIADQRAKAAGPLPMRPIPLEQKKGLHHGQGKRSALIHGLPEGYKKGSYAEWVAKQRASANANKAPNLSRTSGAIEFAKKDQNYQAAVKAYADAPPAEKDARRKAMNEALNKAIATYHEQNPTTPEQDAASEKALAEAARKHASQPDKPLHVTHAGETGPAPSQAPVPAPKKEPVEPKQPGKKSTAKSPPSPTDWAGHKELQKKVYGEVSVKPEKVKKAGKTPPSGAPAPKPPPLAKPGNSLEKQIAESVNKQVADQTKLAKEKAAADERPYAPLGQPGEEHKRTYGALHKAGFIPNNFGTYSRGGNFLKAKEGWVRKNPETGKWEGFTNEEAVGKLNEGKPGVAPLPPAQKPDVIKIDKRAQRAADKKMEDELAERLFGAKKEPPKHKLPPRRRAARRNRRSMLPG